VIDQFRRFWSSTTQAEYAADLVIDGQNRIVAPGFIDIQINGAFGVSFSDPGVTLADLERVGRGILAHGVTAFVPTLVSSAPETYAAVLGALGAYEGNAERGASVLGLHLEGGRVVRKNSNKISAKKVDYLEFALQNLTHFHAKIAVIM
jgi:N-acetylglucosamine-6-phosphate deacetylase